jgi:hypothetical protein
MPLEQINPIFNKENFDADLKNILKEYIITVNDLEHIGDYGEGDEADETEEQELRLGKDKLMNQMVSLTTNALKLTNNKQEIFKTISSIFFDLNNNTYSEYANKLILFEGVILELLKSSSQK